MIQNLSHPANLNTDLPIFDILQGAGLYFVVHVEAVKMLLSRFSDWDNYDTYIKISNPSDWETVTYTIRLATPQIVETAQLMLLRWS